MITNQGNVVFFLLLVLVHHIARSDGVWLLRAYWIGNVRIPGSLWTFGRVKERLGDTKRLSRRANNHFRSSVALSTWFTTVPDRHWWACGQHLELRSWNSWMCAELYYIMCTFSNYVLHSCSDREILQKWTNHARMTELSFFTDPKKLIVQKVRRFQSWNFRE